MFREEIGHRTYPTRRPGQHDPYVRRKNPYRLYGYVSDLLSLPTGEDLDYAV